MFKEIVIWLGILIKRNPYYYGAKSVILGSKITDNEGDNEDDKTREYTEYT